MSEMNVQPQRTRKTGGSSAVKGQSLLDSMDFASEFVPTSATSSGSAEKLAKDPAVLEAVLDRLVKNPGILAKLLATSQELRTSSKVIGVMIGEPAVADAVVARVAEKPAELAKLMTESKALWRNPEVVGLLVREQGVFEALVLRLAKNPEALYRMLSLPDVLRRLPAQTAVLKSLASSARTLEALVAEIPEELQSAVLAKLIAMRKDSLDLTTNSPDAIVAALAVPRDAVDDARTTAQLAFAKAFQTYLKAHAHTILSDLLSDQPETVSHLLQNTPLRDMMMEAIAIDPQLMMDVMVLATAQLKGASTPAERLKMLLTAFSEQPVFRTAMQRNRSLRETLLQITANSFESAGEVMPAASDHVAQRA